MIHVIWERGTCKAEMELLTLSARVHLFDVEANLHTRVCTLLVDGIPTVETAVGRLDDVATFALQRSPLVALLAEQVLLKYVLVHMFVALVSVHVSNEATVVVAVTGKFHRVSCHSLTLTLYEL